MSHICLSSIISVRYVIYSLENTTSTNNLHCLKGDNNRALSVSEKAVLAEPIAWQTRHQLASLQLQRHDPASALALLRSSASSEDIQILRETLPLIAVVEAQIDPAAAQKVASKAAMLTPWDRTVWRALAYTRSCVAA